MGQARTQHLGIHQQAVVAQDVRESPAVLVEAVAVGLEGDVASAHERGQECPCLLGKCCRCIEPPARLRRVDAQQPHPAHVADVQRVAVHDKPDGMVLRTIRAHWTGRQRREQCEKDGRLDGTQHADNRARRGPADEEPAQGEPAARVATCGEITVRFPRRLERGAA